MITSRSISPRPMAAFKTPNTRLSLTHGLGMSSALIHTFGSRLESPLFRQESLGSQHESPLFHGFGTRQGPYRETHSPDPAEGTSMRERDFVGLGPMTRATAREIRLASDPGISSRLSESGEVYLMDAIRSRSQE